MPDQVVHDLEPTLEVGHRGAAQGDDAGYAAHGSGQGVVVVWLHAVVRRTRRGESRAGHSRTRHPGHGCAVARRWRPPGRTIIADERLFSTSPESCPAR